MCSHSEFCLQFKPSAGGVKTLSTMNRVKDSNQHSDGTPDAKKLPSEMSRVFWTQPTKDF
jgi:hypothetical protein